MLNLQVNGIGVPYDSLAEARAAANGNLVFWRETLRRCAKDKEVWNDLLNELSENGGHEEAEALCERYPTPESLRCVLAAIVLQGLANEKFTEAVCGTLSGEVRSMCEFLKRISLQSSGEDAEWIKSELRYWESLREQGALYRVYDLLNAEAPVEYLEDMPFGGWSEEHKTSKLVMRRVEPGGFMMGSPADEDEHWRDERLHNVRVTMPYFIGVFPITQGQWRHIMDSSPSLNRGDARPVEQVSYFDIRGTAEGGRWPESDGVDENTFLARLRKHTKCLKFDLPTEAQWEYACRAGVLSPFQWGSVLNGDKANCDGRNPYGTREKGPYIGSTTDVGHYCLPNAWGLFDMHGNVWEWCLDWYGADYGESETDPVGPRTGDARVIRGGGWKDFASSCRSGGRARYAPGCRYEDVGFRVVS